MSVFGNMAGNAVDLDVGEAVENVLVCDVDYAMGSAGWLLYVEAKRAGSNFYFLAKKIFLLSCTSFFFFSIS